MLFFNAPKGNERANASRHPEPANFYSYFMAINFFAVTLALYPFSLPPSSTLAALCFTVFVLSPSLFYLRTPFLQFFSSPLPNSRYTLPLASFCRLLPPASSFIYTFLPLFFIYLLIFFFNGIPCRRKNPRGLQSFLELVLSRLIIGLFLRRSLHAICPSQRHPVRLSESVFFFMRFAPSIFVFHRHEISS